MRSSNNKIADISYFLFGNYRYKIYYYRYYKVSIHRPLLFLLRKHIVEQIEFRIAHMDRECYHNGECKICHCSTTALQMANKSCDAPCYPDMMNKTQWKNYKKGYPFRDKKDRLWVLGPNKEPVILFT